MKHRLRHLALLLMLALDAPRALLADPPREAATAFDAYAHSVEQRLATQHEPGASFLAATAASKSVHSGSLDIERVTSSPNLPGGARLDHWRGSAFVPHATAAQFEELLRNFNTYPTTFASQVLSAHAQPNGTNRLLATMRVRQHHVLTVVLDADYDVTFSPPTLQANPQRGYSLSRSQRITEIDAPGSPREHALSSTEEHGFLWRLNTYWSWEERQNGLVIQIETVSLSRSVPRGLGWIVGPYVDTIPRDSLEFTLTHAREALARNHPPASSTPAPD